MARWLSRLPIEGVSVSLIGVALVLFALGGPPLGASTGAQRCDTPVHVCDAVADSARAHTSEAPLTVARGAAESSRK